MVSVEDDRGFMSMWLQPQAEGGSEAEEAGGEVRSWKDFPARPASSDLIPNTINGQPMKDFRKYSNDQMYV